MSVFSLFSRSARPRANTELPLHGRLLVAEAGPVLGTEPYSRPRPRIAGWVAPPERSDSPEGRAERARARAGFLEVLGANARVLDDGSDPLPSVSDTDACILDGEPVDVELLAREGRLDELSRLDGSFVVAWRTRDGATHLFRDAVGHRTLYYSEPTPRGLAFASTIAALVAARAAEARLSFEGLGAYLSTAYVPGRRTLVEGVHELLPGEHLRFDPSTLELWRTIVPSLLTGGEEPEGPWGEPSARRAESDRDRSALDEEALTRMLRADLEAAVRARLPNPGEPLGATLSGGIDSSLVIALARQLHDGPIITYSVSFGPGHRNELPFSSLMARHAGTDHRVVELRPDVVARHLDDAMGALAEANGDPLTVPNAIMFREARRDVSVLLNGEGGDPCFGGPKNAPMLLAELLGEGGTDLRSDPRARAKSYLRAHQKCFDDLAELLDESVVRAMSLEPLLDDISDTLDSKQPGAFLDRLMAMNVRWKGPHHILPKIDHLSAIFGVSGRSPLFARPVVARAFQVPASFKLRGSVEKYLLKQAVRDVVPTEIIERPKSGMMVPVESWFQNELLPGAKARILEGLPREVFDRSSLERLLAGRSKGLRPRRGVKIWLLVAFEAWWRRIRTLAAWSPSK
ncbi:MAG: asparagine synthase [Deltaproteobacteria bacterium]|nr:asparagine synthase [Deltaproteobacteria bacterium]